MKGLLIGIVLLIVVGVAGLLYRDSLDRPVVSGACTADARVCPDGSGVGRVAPDCNFAQCPEPNVTLSDLGIVFALPEGFAATEVSDENTVAAFSSLVATSSEENSILVKRYPLTASTTADHVLHATAIGDASGAPVSPSAFTAIRLGDFTYSTVVLGRFEGVVHVAYYLPRSGDVLRFDAIDRGVLEWTNPNLNVSTLPTNRDLRALLTHLQNS